MTFVLGIIVMIYYNDKIIEGAEDSMRGNEYGRE